ncbi:hypothetical protein L6452_08301 [Arctium lappa]|uniref:Uncharacterized protein n=1 Tax=Arctium lappa TaxID=4217 RepID=A0ACB9DH96_ARCLA|nr:hypothetical protein L6452_08301 [Arctium lappa]
MTSSISVLIMALLNPRGVRYAADKRERAEFGGNYDHQARYPAGHDQSSPIFENTSTLEITEERKRRRGDSHVVGQNVIVEKGLHNNVMDVDESRKIRENGKNYNPKDNTTED